MEHLLSMITTVFILGIVLGICFALFFQILSLLAYPMYLSIYTIEGMVSGLFDFKIAKNGYRRVLMDGCGAFCTLTIIQLVLRVVDKLVPNIDLAKQLEFHSMNIPLGFSIGFVLALIGMFTISYFNKKDEQEGKEPDEDDWIKKMQDLKTPKRFRVFN